MKNKLQVVKYDREGYQQHLEKIEQKEKQLRELLKEYGSADMTIDGIVPSCDILDLQTRVSRLRADIDHLKSMKIELVEKLEDSSIIEIGNTYNSYITYPDGSSEDYTFKLVATQDLEKAIKNRQISINCPIGAAVYHKTIGGTYAFKVGTEVGKITVLERVDEKNAEESEA